MSIEIKGSVASGRNKTYRHVIVEDRHYIVLEDVAFGGYPTFEVIPIGDYRKAAWISAADMEAIYKAFNRKNPYDTQAPKYSRYEDGFNYVLAMKNAGDSCIYKWEEITPELLEELCVPDYNQKCFEFHGKVLSNGGKCYERNKRWTRD